MTSNDQNSPDKGSVKNVDEKGIRNVSNFSPNPNEGEQEIVKYNAMT